MATAGSVPRTSTLPESGAMSPARVRSTVVFPEPLPPTSASVEPAARSKVSPETTGRFSWPTVSSRADRARGLDMPCLEPGLERQRREEQQDGGGRDAGACGEV